MKTRHVYSTPGMEVARAAMSVARQAGIADSDLHLVARGDIEERRIPDRRKEADTDLKPALIRGLLMGAVAGLVVAILMALTYGIPITPVGVIGGGLFAGAMIGGLGSMLTGASVPDPIRRQFSAELESGKVLLVIDAEPDQLAGVSDLLRDTGATQLPFGAGASSK